MRPRPPPGRISRRAVLAGLGACLAAPRRAGAADAEPLAAILERSGLGDRAGFAVADLATGEVLEGHRADVQLPPASVAKVVTALYALEALGPGFAFPTAVLAAGPVEGGTLRGDLALVGSGDPLLDTDAVGELAAGLELRGVEGRFLVADGALPAIGEIDAGQPLEAGYNPAVSGMNLNFNRVHLAWAPGPEGPRLSLSAPGARFSAPVASVRAEIGAGTGAGYRRAGGQEVWTLPAAALRGEGSVWLPVRAPAAYAGEVFGRLAGARGLPLPAAVAVRAAPGGAVLAERKSIAVGAMVRGMLRHSTNLTAEVLGLRADQALGGSPGTLTRSAAAMTGWARARYRLGPAAFVNHSGLTDASRMSAAEMLRVLTAEQGRLPELMRERPVLDAEGRPLGGGLRVRAKTGTLFFATALAGYVEGGGRRLGFAILAADMAARAEVPPRYPDAPPGARAWTRRARAQEQALLRRWLALYAA